MKAPLSWLREHAALPATATADDVERAFFRMGLEIEEVVRAGDDITGPVVVGRVLEFTPEPQKNGKTIRWCSIDVGEDEPRGIVCGASNFEVGDLVPVALPGAVLPGDFAIAARTTYGHVSDGMICSTAELGLGDDGAGGILVLAPTTDDGAPVALGTPVVDLLGLRDEVVDVNVTPDIGHCLSVRGLARELAEAFDVVFTDPVTSPVPAAHADGIGVTLADDRCSLFVAQEIHGLDPTRPSPGWMQRRLQLAGVRSISLAVDVTNYVMLLTGQPMHAYDADRLVGGLTVRAARDGETITTLDDVERRLEASDLVVADDEGPVSMLVMGGARTEVGEATTRVVLEAAQFDAVTVARTARRSKLHSEASRRFERGVDPAAAWSAAQLAADLLVEHGGATRGPVTVAGAVAERPVIDLDVELPARVLGADVPADEVVTRLERRGVSVERAGTVLHATPPTWRPDLTDPYDLVEEVGVGIGFDRIPAVLPKAPGSGGLTPNQLGRRQVLHALVAAGATEVLSFPFLGDAELDRLGLPADDPRRSFVRLANPLSDLQPGMRTTLLPGLLAAAARNASRSVDDVALLEIGVVSEGATQRALPTPGVDARPDDATVDALLHGVPRQPRHVGLLLSGHWRPAGVHAAAEPATWRHALHLAQVAAAAVGLAFEVRAAEHAPWHPGRCAALYLPDADAPIGHAGELHPSVCAAFGVAERSCAVEFDLDALIAAGNRVGTVAPLATHPVVKEDVALVVDDSVPAAAVAATLREGAGDLLESVRLFDVYTGDQVGEGKRSLAFALRLRSPERTLTDADAAQVRTAAVELAAERHGAVQRA